MGRSRPAARSARCRARALVAATLLLALPLGCEDCLGPPTLTPLTPSAVVSPTVVAFGTVFIGAEPTREVAVRNIGGAALTLGRTTLVGEAMTFTALDVEQVDAGEELAVVIAFKPEREGWHEGALTVETDDEDAPILTVPITGTARPPLDCDDGRVCTEDLFDPLTGTCSHTQLTGACDDENACTTDERCVDGDCLGLPIACDDGQPCTLDQCDPAAGCVAVEIHDRCDDDDPCTDDLCSATLGCRGEPRPDYSICSEPVTCAMAAICVSGQCQPFVPPDGFPCTDDDVCTQGDACLAGACVGAVTEEPPTAVGDVDRLVFFDAFDAITDDRFVGASTVGGFVVIDVGSGVPHVIDRLQMLELIEDADAIPGGIIVGWNRSGPFFLRVDDDGHLSFGGAYPDPGVGSVTGEGELLMTCRSSPSAAVVVYAMTEAGLVPAFETDVASCDPLEYPETLPVNGAIHGVRNGRVFELATAADGAASVRILRAEGSSLVEEIGPVPLDLTCPGGGGALGVHDLKYAAGRFGFRARCAGDQTVFLVDLDDPAAPPFHFAPAVTSFDLLDEMLIIEQSGVFSWHAGAGTALAPAVVQPSIGLIGSDAWAASSTHVVTNASVLATVPPGSTDWWSYVRGFERLALRPAGLFAFGQGGGFFATRAEVEASLFGAGPEGPFLGQTTTVLPVTVEGLSAGLVSGGGSGRPCSTWSYQSCDDAFSSLFPGSWVSSASFDAAHGPLASAAGVFDPADTFMSSVQYPRARGCRGLAVRFSGAVATTTLIVLDLCDIEGSVVPRGSVEVELGPYPIVQLHEGDRATVVGRDGAALLGYDDPDAPQVLAHLAYADVSVELPGVDESFELYGVNRFTAGYDQGTWALVWTRVDGEGQGRTFTPELAVFSIEEGGALPPVSRGRLDLGPSFLLDDADRQSHVAVVGVLSPRAYISHYTHEVAELRIVSVSGPVPVLDSEVDLRSAPIDLVEEAGKLYLLRHEGVTVVSPPCGPAP